MSNAREYVAPDLDRLLLDEKLSRLQYIHLLSQRYPSAPVKACISRMDSLIGDNDE